MSYEILLSELAVKFLKKLDSNLKERIKSKLADLKENLELGKPLKYSRWWNLRIEDYRAIYKINREKKQIIILLIEHRKRVYDDFSKLLFF